MNYIQDVESSDCAFEISNDMLEIGSKVLMRTASEEMSGHICLAATFMAMMAQHNPDVVFTDGENNFFKFGGMRDV